MPRVRRLTMARPRLAEIKQERKHCVRNCGNPVPDEIGRCIRMRWRYRPYWEVRCPRILQMVEGRPEAPDASIKLRRDADSFRKEPLQLPLAKIAGASKI